MIKLTSTSASRRELRAVLITITLICAGIILPPIMSRMSPAEQAVQVTFKPGLDTTKETAIEQHAARDTLDINLADSAAWDALPGIGPVLSARIIKFRDALGGFYSVEQLSQTYGLSPETFASIRPVLKYRTKQKQIDPKSASIWDMTRHPYIDRQQAQQLKKLYAQAGSGQKDLSTLGDAEWVDKVTPYLVIN